MYLLTLSGVLFGPYASMLKVLEAFPPQGFLLDRLIAAPVGILMHKQGELPLTTVATRRRLDYKPSCLSKHLAEILTQF